MLMQAAKGEWINSAGVTRSRALQAQPASCHSEPDQEQSIRADHQVGQELSEASALDQSVGCSPPSPAHPCSAGQSPRLIAWRKGGRRKELAFRQPHFSPLFCNGSLTPTGFKFHIIFRHLKDGGDELPPADPRLTQKESCLTEVNLQAETVTPVRGASRRGTVCVSPAQTPSTSRGSTWRSNTEQRREAVSERWMPRAADPSESLSSLPAHSKCGAAMTQATKCMESQHSCVHPEGPRCPLGTSAHGAGGRVQGNTTSDMPHQQGVFAFPRNIFTPKDR